MGTDSGRLNTIWVVFYNGLYIEITGFDQFSSDLVLNSIL